MQPEAAEICVVCAARAPDLVLQRARVCSNVRALRSAEFELWRCRQCLSVHAADEVDLAFYYARYPFFSLPDDWRVRALYDNQLRRLRRAGIGPSIASSTTGAVGARSYATCDFAGFATPSATISIHRRSPTPRR